LDLMYQWVTRKGREIELVRKRSYLDSSVKLSRMQGTRLAVA
jgi:hypothetical protein